MPKSKLNRAREHRIDMEVVVDVYTPEERAMSWHCYLEDKLVVPFPARVQALHPASPLNIGDKVEVLGMAPAHICGCDMLVCIRWPKRKLAIPLSQLVPIGATEETRETIADWHYWLNRGYGF